MTKITDIIKNLKSEKKVLLHSRDKYGTAVGRGYGPAGRSRYYYDLEERSPRINRNIRSSILILDTVDSELMKKSRNLKEQIKKRKSAARAKRSSKPNKR